MKADIKRKYTSYFVDTAIPENLVFYIYGSTLDGFMEWIKQEDIDWPASKLTPSFIKRLI